MAKRDSETDDILHEARKAFDQCVDAAQDNRRTALEDIRFVRLNDHWPEDIRRQREIEGRPCLTIPKLPAYVRQVVNDSRQNKPAIKVHPVDSGADLKTAEIISGLIRNIEYTSNADIAYDTGVECAVSGGFGYWRVGMDYAYDDSFEMDLSIDRIANPFSVYEDPNSRAADSSDWDVAFITDRLTEAEYEREYGDEKAKVDWDDDAWSELRGTDWRNDDGVLLAEYWTREKVDRPIVLLSDGTIVGRDDLEKDEDLLLLLQNGLLQVHGERVSKSCKVTQRILSGADLLKTTEWPGKYIPIVPVYGEEFDIEGRRYFRSLVHNALDGQRMFNYWRTTSTELVALAPKVPFIGPKGAFSVDTEKWNTANSKSWPYLEYEYKGNIPPPQRQPLDVGPAAGALQEALNASDDIKAILGMYDASLGARSNETSGRAIMARQREGDVSTFHFQDNLARAIRHTGRILIDLIPKVYNTPRIVRIIGEDGTQTAQHINQQAPQTGKKGEPLFDAEGQAILAMHDLRVGKYDLTVTTGPSFTTRREEAAMHMTELARAFPPAAPVVAPLLAKNLDWPGADELAEKFEKMAEGQIPEPVKQQIQEGQKKLQALTEENQKLKMGQQVDAAQLQADMQAKQAELAMQKQMKLLEIQSEEEIARLKIESEERIQAYRAQLQAEAQAARPIVQSNPRQNAA